MDVIFCPECGSEEISKGDGKSLFCNNCHQEFFSDTDYSDAIAYNMRKMKRKISEQEILIRIGIELIKLAKEHYEEIDGEAQEEDEWLKKAEEVL